jgi:porphobilinogen synthase
MAQAQYPFNQRRLRSGEAIRELTADVRLSAKQFIQPLFVEEGIEIPRNVEGLTGVQVDSIDTVIKAIERDLRSGASKFLIFPVPVSRAAENFDFSFAIRVFETIRSVFKNKVWLAADLCLCSYTTHGHCGILNEEGTKLLNDSTVHVLSDYALALAKVGADCIAPSDMMDGRIAAIRKKLDEHGYDDRSIMSYAAKFSSQFYGPFRDACHSSPEGAALKDRKTYQISPSNMNDAIASALRDEEEGADILMVKPAALYTDVIASLRQRTNKPLAAYHVSGEYAAIELLAEKGLLKREAAHLEVWTALVRSGANSIISYAARYADEWIKEMRY